MNPELLEQVLSCPQLPTLPSVAMDIIERTSDPDVSLDDLASLIERDQGLSARIVRTVNSSFYGLRRPCATIERALVLLGLAPVRSLALGFSLVGGLGACRRDGFDWSGYWERSLTSAVAARALAEAAKKPECADEAFLAALMADIGMIALHQALGDTYERILKLVGGDHRLLTQAEVNVLEVSHAEIGAHLAQRWRLPRSLTMPIRFHERPTAAPTEEADVVRLVALGCMVHDGLHDADPRPQTRQLYEKGRSWFSLEPAQIDVVMRNVRAQTQEMARLFDVEIGHDQHPHAVLEQAHERARQNAGRGSAANTALMHGVESRSIFADESRDPLTGAVGCAGYLAAARRAVDLARQQGTSVLVMSIAVEGLTLIEEQFGEAMRDEATLGVALILNKFFEPAGGLMCRLGRSLFGIVIVGMHVQQVERVMIEARAQVATLPLAGVESAPRITLSVGIACLNHQSDPALSTGDALAQAAASAAMDARAAGGNCVRVYRPRAAA